MDIEDLIMAFSNLQIQDDDDVEMLDVTKYPIEISLETKEDIENTDLIEVDLRKEVTESNDLAKEDIEIPREVDIVKETDSNLSMKINEITKVPTQLVSDETDTESESDVERDDEKDSVASNLQIQDDNDVEMLDVTKYPIETSLETNVEIPREVDIVKETDSKLSTKINKIKKVSNHLASDESDVERDDTESESDVEKDRVVEISIKIPITIRINKRKRQ